MRNDRSHASVDWTNPASYELEAVALAASESKEDDGGVTEPDMNHSVPPTDEGRSGSSCDVFYDAVGEAYPSETPLMPTRPDGCTCLEEAMPLYPKGIDPFAQWYRENYERRIREMQKMKRYGVLIPTPPGTPHSEDGAALPSSVREASALNDDKMEAPIQDPQQEIKTRPTVPSPTSSTPAIAHQNALLNSSSPLTVQTNQTTPSSSPNLDAAWRIRRPRKLNTMPATRFNPSNGTEPILDPQPALSSLHFPRTPRATPPSPASKHPKSLLDPPSTSSTSNRLDLSEFLAAAPEPTMAQQRPMLPTTFTATPLNSYSGVDRSNPSVVGNGSAASVGRREKPLPQLPRRRGRRGFGTAVAMALERQAEAFIAASGGRGRLGAAMGADWARKKMGVGRGDIPGGEDAGGDLGAGSLAGLGVVAGADGERGSGDCEEGVEVSVGEEMVVRSWWGLQALGALDEVREGIGAANKMSELQAGGRLGVSGKWRRDARTG
ncbi:hypothetical protein MBLNU230_g6936t1 [Neophaeotheca triangularis]